VAGVAGGLSCLAKTPGLYFVAAGLLFLCYHEGVSAKRVASPHRDARAYVATVIAGLGLLVAAVALLVRGRAGVAGVVTFVAPIAVLVAALGRAVWNTRAVGASGDRFRGLASLAWPFAAGALAPAVLFAIPYAASGSLGALLTGVFVLPAKRFTFASMDLLPLWTMTYGAGLAVVFWWAARWPARARRWLAVGVGLVLLWVLVSSRRADPYELVWYSVRSLLPVTVFGGALLLASTSGAAVATETRREQLVILLSVAAMCSLVQFPFAAPVYFLYIAPLALLATTALSAAWDPRTQPARAILLVFLLVFAVLRVNPGFIYAMGVNYVRDRQGAPLALERAHLRVTPEDKLTYERTVAAVQAHARGEYIWAGPDAPEVYFLSGKRNPTRTLFDFFDSPTDRTTRVLTAIDAHDVRVVVLHSRPPFSGQLPPDLRDSLERRFPRSEPDGWFQVRWRE